MTYRAILDDGQTHAPIRRVLSGELTIAQADATYKGARGLCPDCEAMRKEIDLADGSSLALAISTTDRSVIYRCGCYAGNNIKRQMHFSHQAGYLNNNQSACNRYGQQLHQEVVETIAIHYRKELGNEYVIEAECQFVKPGTPPETYRPDIVIRNVFGGHYMCIEYQRSPETFEHFVHRHELRANQWGRVIWFFDKRIYNFHATKRARDWLFERYQEFYVCWIDKETRRLQAEPGIFSSLHKESSSHKGTDAAEMQLRRCSIASVINALEDPGWERTEQGVLVPQVMPDKSAGVHFSSDFHKARVWQQEIYERIKDGESTLIAEEKARQKKEEDAKKERAYRQERDELLRKIRSQYSWVDILGDRAKTPALDPEAVISLSNSDLDRELERLKSLLDEADEERERQLQHKRRMAIEEDNKKASVIKEIKELAEFTAIVGDYGKSRALMSWSLSEIEHERSRLYALRGKAAILHEEARIRRAAERAEEEKQVALRWEAVFDYLALWQIDVDPGSVGLSEIDSYEFRVKRHRQRVLDELKQYGYRSWHGQSDESLREAWLRNRRQQKLVKIDRMAGIEAVDALLAEQKAANYKPGWILHRMQNGPVGQNLEAWEHLARHLGYSHSWAATRYRASVERYQEKQERRSAS